MVIRRVIALAAGAAAGVLLWYLVVWARSALEPEPIASFGDCRRYGYDCVNYETPVTSNAVVIALAPLGASAPVKSAAADAAPIDGSETCRAWLSGSDGGIAALSRCLHESRASDLAEQVERVRWQQRTGRAG